MELTKEQYAQIVGITRTAVYYRQDQGQLPAKITDEDVWVEINRLEEEAKSIRRRLAIYIAGENGNGTTSFR